MKNSNIAQKPIDSFFTSPIMQRMGSFASQHKLGILAVTAVSVAALTYAYLNARTVVVSKPDCTDGFFDDLACLKCVDGKFDISGIATCMPDYVKYKNLIDSCLNGTIIDGCRNNSYYREFSQLCLENPKAALCDGNYDHSKWVAQVYAHANTFTNGG